ncbi:MAG: Do family serine endopeptidase [Pseudomonadota bacterium]|nr:Do family serine endopeptidase [Pseudomonadota bacterium]
MQSQSPATIANACRAGLAALALGTSLLATAAPTPLGVQGLPDFTELVERVGPAVVNIRTTERSRSSRVAPGADIDDDMADRLRRFGLPIPNRPRGQQQPGDSEPQQRGVGSGFVLSADGYVMTNAHVVEGAEEVIVTLADKREFKARIVGADKRSDVALVKIEATGLPTVRIGDVGKLKVGEWVIAIGSPFGFESTVTAGIVSAKSRETGELLPLIQTDVAINPGNSGGPLINMRGEVVGINSQIYSQSGVYMGISFAIPIDEASRVSEQLRTGGRVVRGRIGVVIDRVTREVSESIGLGKPTGALVRTVEAGGPAEKAGVEAGDIITKVDSHLVDSSIELPRVIGSIKPGNKATLQVFRRGAYRELPVVVAELEAERVVSRRQPDGPVKAPMPLSSLGLAVADLSDAQKQALKVKSGVRVETAEGVAARAGIAQGDIIMSIDNTEVVNSKQFDAVLAKLDKAKPVTLLVRRADVAVFVILRPVR